MAKTSLKAGWPATVDVVSGPGVWSSVSDKANNLHRFRALSSACFMFATKVLELAKDQPVQERIHVDIHAAKDIGDKKMRVPKISHKRAAELYG